MAKKITRLPAKSPQEASAELRATVEVPVHYVKSNQFRVIHADGVMGGILPSGRAMNIAFYSERIPFPTEEIFDIGPEGHMIEPSSRVRKPGFYREIELSAVLDWETAKSLLDWLEKVVPVLKLISGKATSEENERAPRNDRGRDVQVAKRPGSESRPAVAQTGISSRLARVGSRRK